MQTVGIFGANGFIGRHLTHALADGAHVVVPVSRSLSPEITRLGVRGIEGDLRDDAAMTRALDGVDTVVQLMSSSTPAQGNNRTSEDIESNVIPQVAFLNRCVEAGVRRFVFLSSGGTVYGPVPGTTAVTEAAATNPICSHGVTKLMVEQFVKLHGHLDGMDYMILRVANPYGPGQIFKNGQGLIPALLDRHRQGLPITIFGDGSAARDFVYIDDVVRAIRFAVDLPDAQQEVLNIGSGVATKVIDVVRTLEEVGGFEFKIDYVPERATDVRTIALDTSRAEKVLAWRAEIGFREGISRLLEVTDL